MKRKFKKAAALLSAAACISSMGALNVSAVSYGVFHPAIEECNYFKTNDAVFTYQVDYDSVIIETCEPRSSSIVIPETIDGMPVVALNSLGINPDIEEISFPDSLVTINYKSLHDTKWYKNQPDGVIYAGNVLYDYKGTVPANTTLVIKDGTKSVTESAFSENTVWNFDTKKAENSESEGLVKVVIPDSIEYIGSSAFSMCNNLSEIDFPENKAVHVQNSAFDKTAWHDAQPDGEVYIGDVFLVYKGVMPEGTEIVLRDDTKAIASNALSLDNYHYSYYVDAPEGWTGPVTEDGKVEVYSAPECHVESLVLNDGLEYIGQNLFGYRGAPISEITIPDSVTEIDDWAFEHCSNLTNVDLSDSIDRISNGTFAGCSALESIDIPESVKVIEASAFANTSFKEVIVPKNIEYIGDWAYGGIEELENITIENPNCMIHNNKRSVFNTAVMNGAEYTDFVYNGTITGYKGSLAEAFAEKYGYEFNAALGQIKVLDARTYYVEKGDITVNGSVDLYDAIEISKRIMNKTEFSGQQKKVADFNNDGEVDLYDVIEIAKSLIK